MEGSMGRGKGEGEKKKKGRGREEESSAEREKEVDRGMRQRLFLNLASGSTQRDVWLRDRVHGLFL